MPVHHKYIPGITILLMTVFYSSSAISQTPQLSIGNARILEGDVGRKQVTILVSVSAITSKPISVNYSTENGKAKNNDDYIAGSGNISFEPGQRTYRLVLEIVGETICEEDEDFKVILSNASGATIARSTSTVVIENDDCNLNFPGAPTAFLKKLKIYEVRFTHTGFTTFLKGPDECNIRPDGVVELYGLVYGLEDVGPADDIEYRGILQLDMDMDICSADGQDDNAKLCGMRLVGSGSVEVILDIYYDQRGGYVKFEHKSGYFMQSITGTCGQVQMDEEKTMIPNKTIASIFNGRDLPMLTNRTLRVGRYVEDDQEGNVTVVEVLREIRSQ